MYQSFEGYAEATFPPYISQSAQSCQQQIQPVLENLNLTLPYSIQDITTLVDGFQLESYGRNLLVNALLDLNSKICQISLQQFCENQSLKTTNRPFTTLTLTKSDLPFLDEKLEMAKEFDYLKLKLNGHNDLVFVNRVCTEWKKPFCVDVNQGWENLPEQEVYELVISLRLKGCVLLEQPFAQTNYTKHKWLTHQKLLPVFADESIQNREDLELNADCFDGVNLKLLKCGGLDRALQLIQYAKALNKKIIVGCMSESSCGCATAHALAPYSNFLDIDGPFLISNDPFKGFHIKNGIFDTIEPTGIGVAPHHDFF